MKIARILTSRSFEHNPNYHLIYEWENDLGANLTVPVVDAKPLYRKVLINLHAKKLINRLGKNALEQLNNYVQSPNPFSSGDEYNLERFHSQCTGSFCCFASPPGPLSEKERGSQATKHVH